MRYPAEEKLEIIRLVERSARPAKWTLDKLGVPRRTFYRWYDRYLTEGADGLVDRAPMPKIVWNRIPDDIREALHKMALDKPELSPRELAVTFTDTKGYFVSESSVYRLLKSYDLIASPAFIVMKASNEFRDKTTAINHMWQTDFTYFKSEPLKAPLVQAQWRTAGAGCICRPYWMTSRVPSSAGSCAPR